ncbi:hypothetical protein MSAN_01417400 [Mycena sanguinolenta]|uniref:Uncharacterized protein n=1 Tax=Mycena sanguinolenta TaxID=230812 RepID=A0A8H6Y9P9_9AGAR|nr:hypothetical protein MSAN_01417400 [Mycena sanguinolenta]
MKLRSSCSRFGQILSDIHSVCQTLSLSKSWNTRIKPLFVSIMDEAQLAPKMSLRGDPPLDIHVVHSSIELGRQAIRPLPLPPRVPVRRASEGSFVALEHPPPPRRPTFHVCNPSDSPISPTTPMLPRYSSALISPPINIVPATPLPPPTPGLVHTPQTAQSQPPLVTPTETFFLEATPLSLKHRRRFGKWAESIPQSVLAELRRTPDRNGRLRANSAPLSSFAQRESYNDKDDDRNENEVDKVDPDAGTFVEEASATSPLELDDTELGVDG